MKVRIEEQDLRFKISEEELNTLLSGQSLSVKIGLAGNPLVVTIDPQGSGDALEPKLVLDDEEAHLNLLVSPASVQELSDMGRSRDGLQQEIDGLSVSLQVDLRADSRKACKEG